MEYHNQRLVLLSEAAHTRGLIDRAEHGMLCVPSDTIVRLWAKLDQQEEALRDFDARHDNDDVNND